MVWVAVIAISVLIVVVAVMARQSKTNALIDEGKAIKREMSFWEKSETFTTDMPYEKMIETVQKTDYSELKTDVYPNVNGEKAVLWKSSHAWNAKLAYLGTKDEKYVYKFSFTGWRTRNGAPYHTDSMNMMMTFVEKMFLEADPATTVETHKMQLKTKTKFL